MCNFLQIENCVVQLIALGFRSSVLGSYPLSNMEAGKKTKKKTVNKKLRKYFKKCIICIDLELLMNIAMSLSSATKKLIFLLSGPADITFCVNFFQLTYFGPLLVGLHGIAKQHLESFNTFDTILP